jgi:hypothetical protein
VHVVIVSSVSFAIVFVLTRQRQVKLSQASLSSGSTTYCYRYTSSRIKYQNPRSFNSNHNCRLLVFGDSWSWLVNSYPDYPANERTHKTHSFLHFLVGQFIPTGKHPQTSSDWAVRIRIVLQVLQTTQQTNAHIKRTHFFIL